MQHNPFADWGAAYGVREYQPMSAADAIAAFLAAMEAAGLEPAEPIASRLGGGKLVRFACKGDRAGKANAWAILHLDDGRPAGAFGSWKHGISEKWRGPAVEPMSPAERRERAARYRKDQQRREAERLAAQRAAAAACVERWSRAGPADPAHPYLVAKGIAGEGLRQSGHWLLVPMRDAAGGLWNVQRIAPDGTKRFEKAGRQAELFCLIGDPREAIVIGEGYGTVAVIRRATGLAVVAAFSSANLMATALAIRAAYSDTDLIVAADDDAHLVEHPKIKKNLGMEAAFEAAKAVGGRVAVPPTREAA